MTHATMPRPGSFVLFPTSSSRSTGTCSSLSCGLEESTIGSVSLASLNSRSSFRKARPDTLCAPEEHEKQKEGRIFARRKQAIRRHSSMKSIEDATSSNPSSDGTATKKQRPRRHQSTGTSTEDHVVEEVPLLVPIPMNFAANLRPEDTNRWETLAEKVDQAPKSHCQKGDHQHCHDHGREERRVRVKDCCHQSAGAKKKDEKRRASATLPTRWSSGPSSPVAKQKMWASCPSLCQCQDSAAANAAPQDSLSYSSRWGCQEDTVPALSASSRWDADISNSGHSSTQRRRQRSDSWTTNPAPLRHDSFSERRSRVMDGVSGSCRPKEAANAPVVAAVPSPTLRLPQRKPSTTSLDDDSEE